MYYSADIVSSKIAIYKDQEKVLEDLMEAIQLQIKRVREAIKQYEQESIEGRNGDITSYADYADFE